MSDVIQLRIQKPDGSLRSYEVPPGIYTLGSDSDCSVHLPHASIAGRHAVLTLGHDECAIEDLDAPAGTRIAGERIHGRSHIPEGAPVMVGPFVLMIGPAAADTPPPEPPTTVPAVDAAPSPPPPPPRPEPVAVSVEVQQRRSIKQQIHQELIHRLDIRRMAASHSDTDELEERARTTIQAIVQDVRDRLPPGLDPDDLSREICNEALRLGPLEDLLADPDVTEIMVNGHERVYVEKGGRLHLTELSFMDDASVLAIIERIVAPLGRRIDESQPYVDARLPDGSRVNAIIHPLSLIGPCLTIRKFAQTPFTEHDFIRFGTLTPDIVAFTQMAVLLRKNIVISGGTGSGKTSLLNVLSSFLPSTERILTIEDAAELRLKQIHVVRLEARPSNIEGKGAVTIRDLVRNALRMRPDRIVVGECRGGEALDMLQAMNTGHDGSLTTVHANSPRDVISRLETMVLMSGMDLPIRAIREQIASAIDLIVHESRFSDGTRKVTHVTEVLGLEGDQVTMQDIFEFVQTGVGEGGHIQGHFRPTGTVPSFIDAVESSGLSIDRSMFDPQKQGARIPV